MIGGRLALHSVENSQGVEKIESSSAGKSSKGVDGTASERRTKNKTKLVLENLDDS